MIDSVRECPWLHGAAVVALSLHSLTATAQSSPARTEAPLAEALVGPAKDSYVSARLLFERGDVAGALAKYRQAYDLSKDPRLLFNMAVCTRDLHAYARTQRLLRQYRDEASPGLSADERARIDAALVEIQSLVGILSLTVNEAGAALTIDGEAAGISPFEAPIAVDLGVHMLRLRKDGFETLEREIEASGGAEIKVSMTLEPRVSSSQLAVAASEGATIWLDRQVVGIGRYSGRLAPGIHRLRVAQAGRKTYETEVQLGPGETRSADVTLEPDGGGSPWWPWVTVAVAVAAGTAVGGYFLFKQPDAQTGGPSGQLGTLHLAAWSR